MKRRATTIRLLLAEDHTLVRAGLRALLAEQSDFAVVAEAGDGHEALAQLAHTPVDVLLLDIAMPGLTGLEVLAELRRRAATPATLMLSMHANEEHLLRALELGARGYVLKDSAPDELEQAIRAVAAGARWFSPQLPRERLEDYRSRVGAPQAADVVLTPRQREVLKRIAEGASTREIAVGLGLSVKTIETYRAQLMARTGAGDIASLVRYALRQGISLL